MITLKAGFAEKGVGIKYLCKLYIFFNKKDLLFLMLLNKNRKQFQYGWKIWSVIWILLGGAVYFFFLKVHSIQLKKESNDIGFSYVAVANEMEAAPLVKSYIWDTIIKLQQME